MTQRSSTLREKVEEVAAQSSRDVEVAVVVPAFGAASTIRRCLEVLEEQMQRVPEGAVEVIVVDSGTDATAKCVRKSFPWVRLLRHDGRLYPGAARHLAIAATGAQWLAFLDADCVPGPDWLRSVIDLPRREADAEVFGGPVAADEPLDAVGWAAYLCSFLPWTPDGRERRMDDIPTCSLAFERSTYEEFGPFRAEGYSSDTEFNWKVVAGGRSLLSIPGLEVRHLDRSSFRGFLRRAFERGEAFGRMRIRVQELSWRLRVVHAASMVLLPFLSTFRLVRRLREEGVPTSYFRGAIRSAPLLLLGFVLWSAGEGWGYIAGTADG